MYSHPTKWDERIPLEKDWIVCRNYDEFIKAITDIGISNIELISLDHDLGSSAIREFFRNVVTIIGQQFFYQNISNRGIIIPSTVTAIETQAFGTNTACLDYQFLPVTPPTITTTTFSSIPITAKIYVPDASVSAYKTATNWSTYASYIYPISTRP